MVEGRKRTKAATIVKFEEIHKYLGKSLQKSEEKNGELKRLHWHTLLLKIKHILNKSPLDCGIKH